VPDAADVMADLDVLVAASTLPEPYGLVLVEALASGARIVTTDAGGAPEVAARAREGAASVVQPGSASALANAVAKLLRGLGSTSTDQRKSRPALIAPFPVDWTRYYGPIERQWRQRAKALR